MTIQYALQFKSLVTKKWIFYTGEGDSEYPILKDGKRELEHLMWYSLRKLYPNFKWRLVEVNIKELSRT